MQKGATVQVHRLCQRPAADNHQAVFRESPFRTAPGPVFAASLRELAHDSRLDRRGQRIETQTALQSGLRAGLLQIYDETVQIFSMRRRDVLQIDNADTVIRGVVLRRE